VGELRSERRSPPATGIRRKVRWRRVAWGVAGALLLGPLVLLALYRFVPPPATPLMLLRLAEGHALDYRWVPLRSIAPVLPESVVAAEDNLFCRHWGIDIDAFSEQVAALGGDARTRGASTISMQVAKNLFLWPARSYLRKALELWLTAYVELVLPKRRIIEIYLNIAEWGPGIYGAEAAAQAHFGVSAARLNAAQASLLAAVLPNPLDRSAASPSEYVQGRAAIYRRRAGQLDSSLVGCWK
jgi:monofunctional biosynthetic peptidoglycan transglycosylase